MDRAQQQAMPQRHDAETDDDRQVSTVQTVRSADRDVALRWHTDRLRDITPVQLPHRRHFATQRNHHRQRLSSELSEPLLEAARTLASESHTSVHLVFLTLWQVLLYRYTHTEDLALAIRLPCPDGRNEDTEPDVELLRHRLHGSMSFRQCLQSTMDACKQLFEQRSIPLRELASVLQMSDDERKLPFSNYLFSVQQDARIASGDRPVVDVTGDHNASADAPAPLACEYELCFFAPTRLDSGATLQLEFATDLFSGNELGAVLEHLKHLLHSAQQSPDQTLVELRLMSSDERHTVLHRFNETDTDYPKHRTLTDLLAAQAQRTPENVALSSAQGTLSYRELMQQVDRMASWLKRYSLGPGSLVGVCLPRTPQLLIAHLAIQRIGAAYLPVDPAHPEERRQFILDDARVQLFITSESLVGLNRPAGVPLVLLEQEWDDILSTEMEQIDSEASPSDLAYVIYTSGSTGKPKGVQSTRQNLLNQLLALKHQLEVSESDTMLALSTVAFDISIIELYMPLLSGARCHLVSREIAIDGARLKQVIEQERITLFQGTPATWRLLLEAGWQGDGRMQGLIGGEPLPRDLARTLVPQLQCFWNLYGPTETTGYCTVDRIDDPEGRITVGRPLANYRISILDPSGNPCPMHVTGEICVSGDGTSPGYLDRADLNQQVFVTDALRGNADRQYRTGDLGRWLADGRIECLGRKDHQVKLRGYRIEPGEIEYLLSTADGVDHAVVTLVKSDTEEYLAAYIVPEGAGSTPEALCEHLSASLPGYMVPSSYTFMEALPTSPSGKIDRGSLPAPDRTVLQRRIVDPPCNDTEIRIAALWRELLDQPGIDRNDNFFALGGHSLLAMRFINQIRQSFQTHLSVQTLVTASLAQIAEVVNPYIATRPVKTESDECHSEPLFFESGRHRLFAVLHTRFDEEGSVAAGPPRGAILIAQPLGHEYQRMQRTVRVLAGMLARKGYDVLRFDYAGTGDSSGRLSDIELDDWKQNVVDAASWLLQRSQTERLCGIGVRMGAMLMASSLPKPLNHCVLWDPVFDGQHWVQSVENMTHAAMRNLDRYRREQSRKESGELFGYRYEARLLEQLSTLTPETYETLWTGNSLLLSSSERIHGQTSLHTPIQKRQLKPTQVTVFDDRQHWADFAVADHMVSADRSTQLITRWFL